MKKVLFVCIENANRSQMAQAFAKIHGEGLVDSYSAGSRPSGIVNPKAIAAMQELGYDLSKHDSKSLDDIPQETYEYVVTMGCGDSCPHIPARHREDWSIPDPKHMPSEEFRGIRNLIEQKVKALLEAIRES